MSKPLPEFQQAINEIREVCRKHGIVMYAMSGDRSYAEICLHVDDQRPIFRDYHGRLTNRVEQRGQVVVKGIGR